MKKIALLLAILPLSLFAQSQADYEGTVSRFMEYYNMNQPEKICAMYAEEWGEDKSTLWTTNQIANLHATYGRIRSYQYLGIDKHDPDKVRVFRIVCDKSTHALSLTLNKDRSTAIIRFYTESEDIKKLMEE